MIPTSKRAEQAAEHDIAAAGGGEIEISEEYRALVRRLSTVGTLLSVLVLVTIVIMACSPDHRKPRCDSASTPGSLRSRRREMKRAAPRGQQRLRQLALGGLQLTRGG